MFKTANDVIMTLVIVAEFIAAFVFSIYITEDNGKDDE